MKNYFLLFCLVFTAPICGLGLTDNPPELLDIESIINSISLNTFENEVVISWSSPANQEDFIFEIERASGRCSELSFESIGSPKVFEQNLNSLYEYKFVDNNPVKGLAYYRIRFADKNENAYYSEYIELKSKEDEKLSIEQSSKDPESKTIKINYYVPSAGKVSVHIYNSDGETIESLTNKIHQPGKYQITYDTSNLIEDICYYSIESCNEIITKPLKLYH